MADRPYYMSIYSRFLPPSRSTIFANVRVPFARTIWNMVGIVRLLLGFSGMRMPNCSLLSALCGYLYLFR